MVIVIGQVVGQICMTGYVAVLKVSLVAHLMEHWFDKLAVQSLNLDQGCTFFPRFLHFDARLGRIPLGAHLCEAVSRVLSDPGTICSRHLL